MQGTRSFDYLYDANGNNAGYNLTNSGVNRRNTWDQENRLQAVTENSAQISSFKYGDGDTRVSKRGNGGETMYVNEWYTAALGRNTKHVFAGTARITTKLENPESTGPGGEVEVFQYFYHSDLLGTTSAITDRLGQVWQNITYFPFGEEWVQEGTNNSTIPYRFTGKEFDEETRLSYYGARYYDPRTSVWQSPDPALGEYFERHGDDGQWIEPIHLSLSAYTDNNPVNMTDPDGRQSRRGGNMRNPWAESPIWQLNNMRISRLERDILSIRPNAKWLSSGNAPSPAQQNVIIRNLESQLQQLRSEGALPPLSGLSNSRRSPTDFASNARATFGQSPVWNNITMHRGEMVIQRGDIPLSQQNIRRMSGGHAPFVRNARGEWEPVVLHHVGRREGGLIEVLQSHNINPPSTGGPLHIPGPGSPARQSNFTSSYWMQRVKEMQGQ